MTFDINSEMEYLQTMSFLKSLKDRPGSDRFPMTVALPFLRSKKDDPWTTVATSDDPPAKLSGDERTAMAQDIEGLIDAPSKEYRRLSQFENRPWAKEERAKMGELKGEVKDYATQAGALYPKYTYESEDDQITALRDLFKNVLNDNPGGTAYYEGGTRQRNPVLSGLDTEGLWGNDPETRQFKTLSLSPKQLIELIRINPTPDLLKKVFRDWSNGTTIGRIGAAGSYPYAHEEKDPKSFTGWRDVGYREV